MHYWGNVIEAIFWIATAGIIYGRTRAETDRQLREIAGRTTFTLFWFGISDFIEVGTEAWYRPTWLLLMKVDHVPFAASVRNSFGCASHSKRASLGRAKAEENDRQQTAPFLSVRATPSALPVSRKAASRGRCGRCPTTMTSSCSADLNSGRPSDGSAQGMSAADSSMSRLTPRTSIKISAV